MSDCQHGKVRSFSYGLDRCEECGAVHGVDGRWRRPSKDRGSEVVPGRPGDERRIMPTVLNGAVSPAVTECSHPNRVPTAYADRLRCPDCGAVMIDGRWKIG